MSSRTAAGAPFFSLLLAIGLSLSVAGQSPAAPDVEKLPAAQNILWTDPGDIAGLDMLYGFGGKDGEPQPPFTFVKEDASGTSPKIFVTDGQGRTWNVKWGPESKPEIFCTRLVWACGYIVETEYLVPRGQVVGAHGLRRARAFVREDGAFADARFQLRTDAPKFLKKDNWAWNSNPFLGTPQLNGLKALMMLLSNWDAKDARDIDPAGGHGADSNLAIFEEKTGDGVRYLYFVDDWGASMGRWGTSAARSKWDCASYVSQTPELVRGVEAGVVRWGYTGKHFHDITDGIRVDDVRWLMQYLGQVSDAQLRRALAASGASPGAIDCYLPAVRDRIGQLQRIAAAP